MTERVKLYTLNGRVPMLSWAIRKGKAIEYCLQAHPYKNIARAPTFLECVEKWNSLGKGTGNPFTDGDAYVMAHAPEGGEHD